MSINGDIEECAFKNCKSLKELNIDDGQFNFGKEVFCGCDNLEKITLPISFNTAGSTDMFKGCSGISKIIFTKGNGLGHNYDGNNYRATPWYKASDAGKEVNITLQDVSSIGERTFYNCTCIKGITYNEVLYTSLKSLSEAFEENNVTVSDLALTGVGMAP